MSTKEQVRNALVSYAGYSLHDLFHYDWDKLNECILISFGSGTEEAQEKLAALQEAASNPAFSSARMLFSLFYIRLYAYSQKKEIDNDSLNYFKLSSENEEEVADYIESLGLPRPVIEKKETKVLTPFDEILVRTFNLEPDGIESFKRSFMQKQGLLRRLALALQEKPFTGSAQQMDYCTKLVKTLSLPVQKFLTWEDFVSVKEEKIMPGSSFDSFLEEEGILEEATNAAKEKVNQFKKEKIEMDSSPMEKGREYTIYKVDGTSLKGEVTFIVPKVTVRLKTKSGPQTIPFAQIKGWVKLKNWNGKDRAEEALQEARGLLARKDSERVLIQKALREELKRFESLVCIMDTSDLALALKSQLNRLSGILTRLESLK